ncbi:MAG TPA: DUF5916 domain-containing protein [Acidobacteriota bacterium]|nr:DUF5916 domain-containing protein [Acidobacteriota bacterium]
MRFEIYLAIMLIASPAVAQDDHEAGPVLQCTKIAGQLKIDGSLEDPAWRDANWFDDFRQSVPYLGQKATERTEVAFVYDTKNIYVAVRCFDSQPDRIVATKLRHRDEPGDDDHVQIIFDTYGDQMRGYTFIVNPLGSKEEGQVAGRHQFNWDWNDVWEAKAVVTQGGWQVEIRIPFRVLRFSGAAEQEWGVNVKREIKRKQEKDFVVPPMQMYDISALNYAALLTGLRDLKPERNLQLKPYALAGVIHKAENGGTEARRDLGLDVKYSVTSDLTLDVTINTDFAQVESDDEQVNLTRFSLFYPEKREFFLENSQLFSLGGGGWFHAPDIEPFFSRRIGLHQGNTVPIQAGARLSGKIGKQDVGLLSVRTGASDESGLDTGFYNVARVKRYLGGRSYLGGIFTDSRRGDFASSTIGLDGQWWFTRDLYLQGSYIHVRDPQYEDGTDAYHLNLDLTTDPWGFTINFREIGENVYPDLGFVRRAGYRQQEGSLRRSFRTNSHGIRRHTFRVQGDLLTSTIEEQLESSNYGLNYEMELESGDKLEARVSRNFERLFEPFDLDDELVFAPGDYAFYNAEIQFESENSRRLGIDANVTAGQYYDGNRLELSTGIRYIFNPHLRTRVSFSTYNIDSDHGNLDWRLWGLRLEYTLNSYVSTSAFLQYNSSTGDATLNLRLRWIHSNDSDLFIVFNERRNNSLDRWELQGREALVKVNYRFFL